MGWLLHNSQLSVKGLVASFANAFEGAGDYESDMAAISRIYPSKQPRRPHYIEQWAEKRNLKQADLARQLGADKSLVSRWFSGSSPSAEWQAKLAALFHCDPEALFRHPDDDWLKRFFEGRSQDEIDHIKRSLETTFPRKSVSNGTKT